MLILPKRIHQFYSIEINILAELFMLFDTLHSRIHLEEISKKSQKKILKNKSLSYNSKTFSKDIKVCKQCDNVAEIGK